MYSHEGRYAAVVIISQRDDWFERLPLQTVSRLIYIYTHEIKAGYQMIRLKTSSNWAPGTKTIMHCTLSLMRTYCLFIIPEWRCGHPLILWSVCALKLFLFLCQLSWRPRKRQKRWRCSRWSKQWSLDLDDFDMFWWKTKNLESWCGSWTNCSTSWCLFCSTNYSVQTCFDHPNWCQILCISNNVIGQLEFCPQLGFALLGNIYPPWN